jgi:hypothetical protein
MSGLNPAEIEAIIGAIRRIHERSLTGRPPRSRATGK